MMASGIVHILLLRYLKQTNLLCSMMNVSGAKGSILYMVLHKISQVI